VGSVNKDPKDQLEKKYQDECDQIEKKLKFLDLMSNNNEKRQVPVTQKPDYAEDYLRYKLAIMGLRKAVDQAKHQNTEDSALSQLVKDNTRDFRDVG
jgi:hypothetical protein